MEKKEISEIKKTLNLKKGCRIDTIATIYVDDQKNVVSTTTSHLASIGEEEAFKYLDFMKKALSGKLGKNLFNISFPAEEENEGGKQSRFMRLVNSVLQDEDTLKSFAAPIIENFVYPGKYLIVVGEGVYDVPAKASDGAVLEDSQDVYTYVIGAVCPVILAKDGLCFTGKSFMSRNDTWMVDKPDFGFLFPAFNGRTADVHSALYYAKKDLHEDLVANLFGTEIGKTADMEKDAFSIIVQDTFGRNCSYDKVKEITDTLTQKMMVAEANDEPAEISKNELRKMLENAGATDEGLKQFERSFDENAGKTLNIGSLVDKTTKIKSNYVDVSISTENTDYLESKVIDGREYLLVPVADDIMMNGIPIAASKE
jgi:hypothetical protein